jgi:hypothetical protein
VVDDTATVEQAQTTQQGINLQGINLQGINLQGINLQGINLQGFDLQSVSLSGSGLTNVHIQQGELVGDQGGVTLRGAQLVGTHLYAKVRDSNANPPVDMLVEYRIAAVTTENPAYDPTGTGLTFLYTLEQWVSSSSTWQLACPADGDNVHAAIPLDAWWDEHGDRYDSSAGGLFTFGCTSGVIAKCYRWGYRPWVEGYGDLTAMHWACTRLARADYCGDGVSRTQNGTWVNVWDTLATPLQTRTSGTSMVFEAAWTTAGAVCVDHTRWPLTEGQTIATMCPNETMPSCDSVQAALLYDSTAKLFNESYLNP